MLCCASISNKYRYKGNANITVADPTIKIFYLSSINKYLFTCHNLAHLLHLTHQESKYHKPKSHWITFLVTPVNHQANEKNGHLASSHILYGCDVGSMKFHEYLLHSI